MNEKIALASPDTYIFDEVLMNTTEIYGALQGIAGSSAIVHIDALELPYEEDSI